jgi:hypothetical protein
LQTLKYNNLGTQLSALPASVTYKQNAVAVKLLPAVTVTDADSYDFNQAKLRLAFNANSQSSVNRLQINGVTLASGANVTVGGQVIGKVVSGGDGTGTNPLVILFNSRATRGLNSVATTSITRGIDLLLQDGDGKSTTAAISLNINP